MDAVSAPSTLLRAEELPRHMRQPCSRGHFLLDKTLIFLIFFFSIQGTVGVSRDLSPVSCQLSCAWSALEASCCMLLLAGAKQCHRQLVLFEDGSVHWKYRDMSRIRQTHLN